MQTIDQALAKLQKSAFRRRFHLSVADKAYIADKGLATIRLHAADFVRQRLAPAQITNDGHQTPMRGHPVFIAQHATSCCCRKCLHRWYHLPLGIALTAEQQEKIVNLLMAWLQQQMEDDVPR